MTERLSRRALVAAAFLVLAGGAQAHAQTPISVGQTLRGQLSASDPKASDNSYYDIYTVTGRRGERILITMRSSEFDAYLAVGRMNGSDFDQIDSDDDSGGGTDAQVDFTLPSDGTFVIRANTLSAGETGAYSLQVEPRATDAPHAGGDSDPTAGVLHPVGSLRMGQTVRGDLSASDPKAADNSYYDDYTFTGRRGDHVVVTMRSGAFDAFLAFGTANGDSFDSSESDDDSGGGTDARIDVTLPADGTYVIRANTLRAGETGSYTLEMNDHATGGTSNSVTHQSSGGSDDSDRPVVGTRIRAGTSVSGTLDENDPLASDDTHYDDWIYSGRRGERLIITLRSRAFDTYLQFGKLVGGKFQYIDAEDDGAGGTDSLMAITLPDDGDYVIRANTLFKATGAYTLQVESAGTART